MPKFLIPAFLPSISLNDDLKQYDYNNNSFFEIGDISLFIDSLFSANKSFPNKSFDPNSDENSDLIDFIYLLDFNKYDLVNKQNVIETQGTLGQYSPWVIREPGWQSTLVYYCKNTFEPANQTDLNNPDASEHLWNNEIGRDRVWRSEFWGDHASGSPSSTQIAVDGIYDKPTDLSCTPSIVINEDTGK